MSEANKQSVEQSANEEVVLPLDPSEWGDVISDLEEELPQDPNVVLMDIDAIYEL
ncbi:hypothetical protein ACFQ3J_14895 [Paenibacillus provencensis]|uniref:Uncharacterized protein n=1 Tax=Paenibacillus provencensis TaxID=441151 RepID=A0ABW3PQR2_9BACL|nr:hypothetical protein [Paenibacillus sp. MER 78]MCM3127920.1 hypothetical protein [Paenibacillus sp. MER 78]